MNFELTAEQTGFARSLDDLLSRADALAVNRAWAAGDRDPGTRLWSRLADLGVTALATEATPVEMCVAFEALGRYAVPGPWIESAAYLPVALPAANLSESWATVAMPYALDADVVTDVYAIVDAGLHQASAGDRVTSVDPSRHLFEVTAGEPVEHGDLDAAFDLAVLATAAELLGAGERVLADTVAYVKQRTQFGRAIGSYQAIKHQLADVRIALDFARPLVFGAAVDPSPRAVSAARVHCASASRLAARVGLQAHGAIGFTDEYDLSRWLLRIQALQSAWGTPAFHRERVLTSLLDAR
ncbi:acyl-CoA dehydrogenase family protein [Aeromicrobium sp.]|uniref:acyl-CoA dehydrogenase family protein n=1 Tax=Aeromicrobium sp. TaxID=1871063 RepID=UPI0030C57E81